MTTGKAETTGSSAERVLAALDSRRTDRVPRHDSFWPEFVDAWRAAKELPEGADISNPWSRRRAEASKRIKDAADGGGFILSTGDQVAVDTPEENFVALIQAARCCE